jgi:histidinol-phosphate phosphatase family protein
VFLDRDGTIIEDRGHLAREDQVEFFPEAVPALLRLQERFALFLVTNQSGVSKGEITLEDVQRVNDHVVSVLAASGVRILETYVCPHQRSDGCDCIKPRPFFLEKAAADHGVDLSRSFVIGDHPHDIAFGADAGLGAVYVLSGHGRKHRPELPEGVTIVAGIREAVDLILET